jgi:hypothetical protein
MEESNAPAKFHEETHLRSTSEAITPTHVLVLLPTASSRTSAKAQAKDRTKGKDLTDKDPMSLKIPPNLDRSRDPTLLSHKEENLHAFQELVALVQVLLLESSPKLIFPWTNWSSKTLHTLP